MHLLMQVFSAVHRSPWQLENVGGCRWEEFDPTDFASCTYWVQGRISKTWPAASWLELYSIFLSRVLISQSCPSFTDSIPAWAALSLSRSRLKMNKMINQHQNFEHTGLRKGIAPSHKSEIDIPNSPCAHHIIEFNTASALQLLLKRDPIGNKHHLRSAWMNIGAQMLVHHWFWIVNLYIYIYIW